MIYPHHRCNPPQHRNRPVNVATGATAGATAGATTRALAARVTHLDTDQIGVIELDGKPVEYVIRRSVRRTRAMLSLSDRGLVLAVPLRMPARSIESFLAHSQSWLRRHLPRWQANTIPDPELAALHRVLWQGDPLVLSVVAAPGRPAVTRMPDQVKVSVVNPMDLAQVRCALRGWLQDEALPLCEARARHFAPAVGVAMPPVKMTSARTLWGSCTPAGLVRINWRLVQAPSHLLDYVVVHELAHLVEANHSSRFWAVVARGYPAHREARRELTEWQRRLAIL